MQFDNGILGQLTQFRRELDLAPALAGGMKDSTAVNHDAKHFFETERLGAELGIVVVKLPAFAFLKFDRAQRANALALTPSPSPIRWERVAGGRVREDFDNVAFAGETEPFRPDRQCAQQGYALGDFIAGQVRVLMRDVAADGVLVLLAMTFNRLQRRAAPAVKEIVEQRKRQRVHFRFKICDLRFTIEAVRAM